MATLKNHPGFWMRDDAAASLARWEADHGVIGVNSAGRTAAEQQNLINRWNQGGTYNRPPYLYEPKRPATASSHVANGGIAFDTSEYVRFRRTCAAYGWWQPYDWDVVHFEYNPKRDKNYGKKVDDVSAKDVWYYPVSRGGKSVRTIDDLVDARSATIRIENELKPITRDGKPVPIRQELADAKTNTIHILAEVKALTAAVQALALSQGADPAAILKAVQDGVKSAMKDISFTTSIDS